MALRKDGDCFVAKCAPRNDNAVLHPSSFILPMKRSFSLRRGADFQRVWEGGKSFAHPLVVGRVRANGTDARRFGFVAGKKIGKATARNRAKRLLRESVRRYLPQIVPGWDVILIARGAAPQSEFKEIASAVENILRRANLLRNS
ncbi:MAG: ribonuclease P protein component [Chloroflexi bacterium]|nr:ribonuclease P protein component [Chloroflexota bacterium]